MAQEIIAIVQARMDSTRLPNKMTKNIIGKPMIQHVLDRLAHSRFINVIILATTRNTTDDSLFKLMKELGYVVYRGSENDVLGRYYQISLGYNVKGIVRITGDCPLIDHKITDQVIEYYLRNNFDYVSNTNPPTFPDGLDTEIFSFKALQKANQEATLMSEREHVVPYIVKNPHMFKIGNVLNSGQDLSNMRWTVDTPQDLQFIRKIFELIPKRKQTFHMADILDVLDKNPKLIQINNNIKRNEGYLLSLKQDRLVIK